MARGARRAVLLVPLVWLWAASAAYAATSQWPQYLVGTASGEVATHLVWSSPSQGCNTDSDYKYSAQVVLKLVGPGGGYINYRLLDAQSVQFVGSSDNVCPAASGQQSSSWSTTVGLTPTTSPPWSGFLNIAAPPTGNLEVDFATTYTGCTGPGCGGVIGPVVGAPAPNGLFDSNAAAPLQTVTTSGSSAMSVKVDVGGTTTKHYSGSSGTWTRTIVSTANAHLTTPATLGPMFNEDKLKARADLLPAIYNARIFCTPHALGLLGFGTGVLLLGVGPVIGSSLVVAGSLTAVATQPFCLAAIRRVVWDYRRWKDPPNPNFHRLVKPTAIRAVRLPSCSRRHGSARAFCVALSNAETAWAQAAELVASIDQALATTMARESSALAASDQAAVNLQDAHLAALEKQETTALRTEAAAGKRIARLLRSHDIAFRLTKSQSSAVIKALDGVLAKQGISTTALAPAGIKLKPQATDVLKALPHS